MSEKTLKIIIGVFIAIVILMFLSGRNSPRYGDINIQTMVSAAEGLNLKAVGELVKKAKNAEDFERLLNQPGGVNNLDLNEDGKVDYIHVTEYGDKNIRGFSLTVQPQQGETQEIATIEVEKKSDKAQVQIHGNEQIYGNNCYYHYSSPLTTFLIMGYLFSPHRMFYSPWRYGHYPGWYSTYRTVPHSSYRNRTSKIAGVSTVRRASSPLFKNSPVSPNRGKVANSGIRAPLKNPTRSQRSFQARNPSRLSRRASGFGRRYRPSRPSVRTGGFGRSGGYFGGK